MTLFQDTPDSGTVYPLHRAIREQERRTCTLYTVVYNRGSRFLDFSDFQCQVNLDWKKNSKTNEENTFFFIFMSSYPEMSFLAQIGRYGCKKYVILR
jgi:hypothetical protein